MTLFCMAILDAVRSLKMSLTVVTHELEIQRILSKSLLLIYGFIVMHN